MNGLFGPSVPEAAVTGAAPSGAAAESKPVLPVHGGTVQGGGKTPTNDVSQSSTISA